MFLEQVDFQPAFEIHNYKAASSAKCCNDYQHHFSLDLLFTGQCTGSATADHSSDYPGMAERPWNPAPMAPDSCRDEIQTILADNLIHLGEMIEPFCVASDGSLKADKIEPGGRRPSSACSGSSSATRKAEVARQAQRRFRQRTKVHTKPYLRNMCA